MTEKYFIVKEEGNKIEYLGLVPGPATAPLFLFWDTKDTADAVCNLFNTQRINNDYIYRVTTDMFEDLK